MQYESTDKRQPFRKKIAVLIAFILLMLSRSWISDQITDRKDKRLFNLIAVTAMVAFMFIVFYYRTRAVEYLKYRPFVYLGILVYLAFFIFFFYIHFRTPA